MEKGNQGETPRWIGIPFAVAIIAFALTMCLLPQSGKQEASEGKASARKPSKEIPSKPSVSIDSTVGKMIK